MSGWKYAFSLSKADIEEATPPGTISLVDHHPHNHTEDKKPEEGLTEHNESSTNYDEVVRFPQPSADPADPLNWVGWRKFSLLLVASLFAFVGNFQSACIAPALSIWYTTFPQEYKTYPELVHLVAVNVLMMGASNIWWVPLSNTLGRRPVLLVASLLLTLCSVWAGRTTSYSSLLAARIFQGIGAGPSETVAPALIGEVYFIDERGRAMAIYTSLLALGSLVGGISGSYIGYQEGWDWIFWICTILSGLLFLGVFFFVPETLYVRETIPSISSSSSSTEQQQQYCPYTFTRSLGFGTASPSQTKRKGGLVVQKFLQPWRTLALPGTWVVMLHYAGLVGGVVTISTVGAQIVSAPPYLWGANAGLINIGGLVGVVLGAAYTYVTADRRLLGRARGEDHGYAEPESRLPTMFPSLVVATLGFFVFGFCAQYPGTNRWVGLQVGYGMLSFGLMQIPSIGFNYLIDSYSYLAGDCFVIVTILRSIIAFAWTFFVSDWVASSGAAQPFGIFGMLMGLFSLLIIPLWLFGKRMRVATAGVLDP